MPSFDQRVVRIGIEPLDELGRFSNDDLGGSNQTRLLSRSIKLANPCHIERKLGAIELRAHVGNEIPQVGFIGRALIFKRIAFALQPEHSGNLVIDFAGL